MLFLWTRHTLSVKLINNFIILGSVLVNLTTLLFSLLSPSAQYNITPATNKFLFFNLENSKIASSLNCWRHFFHFSIRSLLICINLFLAKKEYFLVSVFFIFWDHLMLHNQFERVLFGRSNSLNLWKRKERVAFANSLCDVGQRAWAPMCWCRSSCWRSGSPRLVRCPVAPSGSRRSAPPSRRDPAPYACGNRADPRAWPWVGVTRQ